MTGTAQFPLRSSYAAQEQVAEPASRSLQLQAATPGGERADEHLGAEYREVWDRAPSLAGEDAPEDLLLTVLTHAHVLLAYLVAATGIGEAGWLDRLRADCVDRVPSTGTGVRGPHDLRLG